MKTRPSGVIVLEATPLRTFPLKNWLLRVESFVADAPPRTFHVVAYFLIKKMVAGVHMLDASMLAGVAVAPPPSPSSSDGGLLKIKDQPSTTRGALSINSGECTVPLLLADYGISRSMNDLLLLSLAQLVTSLCLCPFRSRALSRFCVVFRR